LDRNYIGYSWHLFLFSTFHHYAFVVPVHRYDLQHYVNIFYRIVLIQIFQRRFPGGEECRNGLAVGGFDIDIVGEAAGVEIVDEVDKVESTPGSKKPA